VDITEVRIKLTNDPHDRLKAFCSITLDDCFVIRDLKVIEGAGGVFVAMPSRKIMARCRGCHAKNHLRAAYCNECGRKLNPDAVQRGEEGQGRLYADVAHPINSACRDLIQERVLDAFEVELKRADGPDYVSHYDDDYGDEFLDDVDFGEEDLPDVPASAPGRGGQPKAVESRSETQAPPGRRRHTDEEPRGPHKKPESAARQVRQGAEKPSSPRSRPSNEEFGAGIF
jgi:stage V sporulation protein G